MKMKSAQLSKMQKSTYICLYSVRLGIILLNAQNVSLTIYVINQSGVYFYSQYRTQDA